MTSPAFPLLSLLLAIPAVGSLAVVVVGRARASLAERSAVALAAVVFVLSLAVVGRAGTDPGLSESHSWIRALGSDFTLGVDPVSAGLAVWVAALVLAVVYSLSRSKTDYRSVSRALFSESMALGLFFARDTLLLLSFYGASVIAMALWIPSLRARRKFLVYQLVGLTFWIGFFAQCFHLVFIETGFFSTELARWHALVLYPERERSLFLVALAGCAFAMPLFPASGWLRDTFETVPRAGRLLFYGIFSLVTSDVLFRLVLPMCSLGARRASVWVLALAFLSILTAALAPGRGTARLLVGFQGLVLLGTLTVPQTVGFGAELGRLAVAVGMTGLVRWRSAAVRTSFAVVLVAGPLVNVIPFFGEGSRFLAACTLVAVGLLAVRLVRDTILPEVPA